MEIKLFGRSLFEVKKNTTQAIYNTAHEKLKESKFLPDFQSYDLSGAGNTPYNYISLTEVATLTPVDKNNQPIVKKKEEPTLTPKDVFTLQLLHDKGYELKTDPTYLDEQIAAFKEKLELIKSSEFDMNHGTSQIASILIRLENRKKYSEVHKFFEEYPYTTGAKIDTLIKEHSNLQLGTVAQFVADLPKEAIDTMKEYNKQTKSICEKEAIFYIIADKKDFQKTQSRRDPILLAQSPFAHVWQICGAWDKECIFVDEL